MTVNEGTARPAAGVVAAVAVASAAPVLYALWIRRQFLTWGASRDEITRAWPGDERAGIITPIDPAGGGTGQ